MSENQDTTFATRFLFRYPAVRHMVSDSQAFVEWKNQFSTTVIDGITYYLRGGNNSSATSADNEPIGMGADWPQEEDELVLEWARQHRLISEDDINRMSAE